MTIVPATPADRPAIEALLDDAFGTDRHSRAAYRLREGNHCIAGLGFIIRDAASLCASIEFWPVALAYLADGARTPALLLGPIAVAAAYRGKGLGDAIIRHGIAAAEALGWRLIILVGDKPYYQRFGFDNVMTLAWRMPGPVDQQRVLARVGPGAGLLPEAADIVRPL